MKKKNQIEVLLEQVAELLDQIHQHGSDKPESDELPQLTEEKVWLIEQYVDFFRRVTDKAIADVGMSDAEIKQTLRKPPHKSFSPRERRTLDRAQKLKQEVQAMRRELAAQKRAEKEPETEEKKKTDTSKKVARRKKFKRLGGKDDWMPL